jgi:hypothetical protein
MQIDHFALSEMVSRGEPLIENNLSRLRCPTYPELSIESQSLFSALSPRDNPLN